MFRLVVLSCLFIQTLADYIGNGYVLKQSLRDYVIVYGVDITSSGIAFTLQSSLISGGPGPYYQFVNTFDRINKNLIQVNQTGRCGSYLDLLPYASNPKSIDVVCLSPSLVLRRGYYYVFDEFGYNDYPLNMCIKSAPEKTFTNRLGSSDGVINNCGAGAVWQVSETESRTLYYITETAQYNMNGTIDFIDPCDNGGTSHGHGNCTCMTGFYGVACQYQTCPYGGGITENNDDGCLCDKDRGGIYCEFLVTYNQCGRFQSLPQNFTINPTLSECDCGAKWSDAYNISVYMKTHTHVPGNLLRTPFNYAGAPMWNLTQAKVTCYYNVLCDAIAIWPEEASGKSREYYFMITYSDVYQSWMQSNPNSWFSELVDPKASSLLFYTLNRYYKKNCLDIAPRFHRDRVSDIAFESTSYAFQYIDLSFVYRTYRSLMACPYTMLDGSCCFNFSNIATSRQWVCTTPNPTITDLDSTLSLYTSNSGIASAKYPTWAAITNEYIQLHMIRDGMNISANCSSIPLVTQPLVCPDECSPNPCMNNGTCFDNFYSFMCTCPVGFNGTLCEINMNECLSNPCLNGASCVNGLNSYTCQCTDGYYGLSCQTTIGTLSNNIYSYFYFYMYFYPYIYAS
jgi:hypothetical protein